MRRITPQVLTDLAAKDDRPDTAIVEFVVRGSDNSIVPTKFYNAPSSTQHITQWLRDDGTEVARLQYDGGVVSQGNCYIAGVLTLPTSPVNPTDAVNKSYVDALVQGISWKQQVRAASTANITLSGPGTTIDGVTLANGDRFLAKNQSTGGQNGIYVFNGSAVAATRAPDADTGAELVSAAVLVAEGTTNHDVAFICTTDAPITIGTTATTWVTLGSFLGLGALAFLNTVGTAQINSGAVTFAKLQSSSAASLIGDGVGGSTFGQITLDSSLRFPTSTTLGVAVAGVTYALFQDVTGLSVVGRASNSSGVSAAITAITDGHALRLSGTTLGFGTIVTAGLADKAVTYAKIQDETKATLLGNPSGSTNQAPSEIGLHSSLVFSSTLLKIATQVGLSVFGVAGSSTTDMAAITFGTDGHVLRRSSSTVLGTGTLLAGSFATSPGIVTLAMLDNAPALSVTCRAANSSGARGDVALATNGILQNQASVLVSTTAPINLDLSNSGNDLGSSAGGGGCKGRPVPFPSMFTDASGGTGLTTIDLNIDGTDSATTRHAVPVACKITKVAVTLRYGNGSALTGGPWRLVIFNDSTSSAEVLNLTQSTASYGNNVTSGALSNNLAFSAGDRIRAYIEANGATSINGAYVSLTIFAVAT